MLPSLYIQVSLLTAVVAQYSLVDDYGTENFASKFNFFTGNDPTNGYVNYVDQNTAQSGGLYSTSKDRVYIGVDHNNTASGRGRNSVRIESKKSYQHGLIVLDLAHMPASTCGTWPAFWLLSTSAQWPNGGEVDIIEGVNSQTANTMAVHTNAGCTISNTGGMSGEILTPNCDINAAGQSTNQGCAISSRNSNSYGTGFNSIGGGVYATQWTSDGISIWFFPRSAIPADLASGSPDPSGWGLPMGRFAGNCDWDDKIVNQQIIFDTTFCGDWAGQVFSSDPICSSKASTCQAFVQNNPSAFADSYWSINSLKVYQQNGRAPTPSVSTRLATPTTTVATTKYTTPLTLSTITVTTSSSLTILPVGTTSALSVTTAPPGISTSTEVTASYSMSYTVSSTTLSYSPTSQSSPSTFSTYTKSDSWTAWSSRPTGNNNWGNWNRPPNGGGPGSWHQGPPQ